ncbi:MAG: hypothetical protein IJK35_01280 [Oscillospiraceae bacterium]|nr:hypothetical protein [Oscillospiraceae bacterium]
MAGKRQRLDIQRQAEDLLAAPLSGEEELCRELEARGVKPNGAGALLYAQFREAVGGDLKAAAFLRDLARQEEPKKPARKKQAAPELRELSDAELLAMLAEGGRGDAP